ncbi:MAG: hypothetical protein ACQKBW_04160 [Puniceicoccales bacterium]
MLALFTTIGVVTYADAVGADDVTLIGQKYGSMEIVPVDDCKGLTEAWELDCTASAKPGDFGLSFPAASFDLQKGKVYALSFYAKLTDVFDTITVSIDSDSGKKTAGFTYQLSGQWTQIFVPFKATGQEARITMTLGGERQKVYVGGLRVEASGVPFEETKSGYYMVESDGWETVVIDWDQGMGIGDCTDVIANGEYVYAITNRALHVFKANGRGEDPTLIKSTEPYGDLRQMSMTYDKKAIVATARANEVYVFDISDPENPVVASRIDSIEAATGIDVQGKYCYIADRSYGVDIFDISDIYNPVMISNIPTGESQDCKVYDGYLYAGVWGARKVRICDVRDVDNPKIIGEIQLRGRGDGVNIKDGILYAATGHMEDWEPQSSSQGYGNGNGMEIYDVRDPRKPVLLSRVRTDGQMYCSHPDIWRVSVAGNYAYLSSSFSGIYVFDTTDKRLPKRVARIDVVAQKGEPGYANVKRKSSWVFPFDTEQVLHGALIDCDVQDGTMYIASKSNDLYVLHGKDYLAEATDDNDSTVFPGQDYSGTYYTNDLAAMGFKNPKLFKPGSQVWSSARYGDYIYVASGSDGIYVIDDDMNVISQYPSNDITNDIQIVGNRIYAAENTAGLCIYEIDESSPDKISLKGTYKQGVMPIVEVALSPDARYALVQTGNVSALLDVSDVERPTLYQRFPYTMVYQNQMTRECAQDRYLMIYTPYSKTVVCDFGENGSYEKPVIHTSWVINAPKQMVGGLAADGDFVLAMVGDSVYRFNPSNEEVYKMPLGKNPELQSFQVKGVRGKPAVIGDYVFVADRMRGDLSILKLAEDRSELPVLVKEATFKGNPARAIAVGDRVYLPLGYGGLASFDMAGLSSED